MSIRHRKVSTKPDDPNTALVRPSDWNDTHAGPVDLVDIPSLPDGTLDNAPSLKRLLSSRPDLASLIPSLYVIPEPTCSSIPCLAFDGTFLYAGLASSPAKILQIDPLTMLVVKTWTADAGVNSIAALATDGSFLYAITSYPSNMLFKFSLPDLSVSTSIFCNLAVWTRSSFVVSAGILYLLHDTHPYIFWGVRTSDLSFVWFLYGSSGQNNASCMTFDGTYCYAGFDAVPALVIKINPLTFTVAGSYTINSGMNSIRSLCFDGSFIYACMNTVPAYYISIIPQNMTLNTFTIESSGYNYATALCFDGSYIYAGLTLNPVRIRRLTLDALAKLNPFTARAGSTAIKCLLSGGKFMFASFDGTSASLLRKVFSAAVQAD